MCSQSKTIVQGDGTFAKRIAAGKCPKCKTSVTSFTHSFDQGDYWELFLNNITKWSSFLASASEKLSEDTVKGIIGELQTRQPEKHIAVEGSIDQQ